MYDINEKVEKYTVTYIEDFDPERQHDLYRIGYGHFGAEPKSYYESIQASNNLEATATTFGMYAAAVYFNEEDVIEQFDRDIATLNYNKQIFIKELNHD